MSVKDLQELLDITRDYMGDDTSDTAISFVQDLTDTINDLNDKANNNEWKTKYETNDAEWRKKYRDTFFNTTQPTNATNTIETPEIDGVEEIKIKTYDELFK